MTVFVAFWLALFGVLVVAMNLVTALWESAYLTFDVGKRVLERVWERKGDAAKE
jgi:hypothetical protein